MTKHLLTIDDEAEIRELLREALTAAGYRVSAVATWAEAREILRTDPPVLVLTDLQLVDSDGFEVVEQVKVLQPAMPIIMLTGVLMDPDEIPEEVGSKIAAYVPKTAPLKDLLQEVKRWAG
ncbi:MAG: response regulator [Verrucomicrobia bacterium]|nr:response regulator [Verrucomicrobiota bacterium]